MLLLWTCSSYDVSCLSFGRTVQERNFNWVWRLSWRILSQIQWRRRREFRSLSFFSSALFIILYVCPKQRDTERIEKDDEVAKNGVCASVRKEEERGLQWKKRQEEETQWQWLSFWDNTIQCVAFTFFLWISFFSTHFLWKVLSFLSFSPLFFSLHHHSLVSSHPILSTSSSSCVCLSLSLSLYACFSFQVTSILVQEHEVPKYPFSHKEGREQTYPWMTWCLLILSWHKKDLRGCSEASFLPVSVEDHLWVMNE